MPRSILILIYALLSLNAVYAQEKPKNKFTRSGSTKTKEQLLGIHFNLADFNGPAGIKDPVSGKVYHSITHMDKGFSVSYWRGINPKADFSAKMNIMFRDYRAIYYNNPAKTNGEIGIELEPSVNIHPYGNNAKVNPFLTAGIGAGYYTGHWGAYIPAGLGIQANFNNITYFFLQAQYKFTLTPKTLGDNLFYSLGFAEPISRKKIPLPPPPPPPINYDRDGDGVNDEFDRCPDVAGTKYNNGCPDMAESNKPLSIKNVRLKVMSRENVELTNVKCYFLTNKTCRDIDCKFCFTEWGNCPAEIANLIPGRADKIYDCASPPANFEIPFGSYHIFIIKSNKIIYYELKTFISGTAGINEIKINIQ